MLIISNLYCNFCPVCISDVHAAMVLQLAFQSQQLRIKGVKLKDISNLIYGVEWPFIISLMTPIIIISLMTTRGRSVGVEISYQLAILVFLWKIFVSLISLLFSLRVSSDPVLLSSPQGSGWQGRLPPASSGPASSWWGHEVIVTIHSCHNLSQFLETVNIVWKLSCQGLCWPGLPTCDTYER